MKTLLSYLLNGLDRAFWIAFGVAVTRLIFG